MPIHTRIAALTIALSVAASRAAQHGASPPSDAPEPGTLSPAAQLEALIAEGQPEGENAWPAIARAFFDRESLEAKTISLLRGAQEPWAEDLLWADFHIILNPAWRDDPVNDDLSPENKAGAMLAERLIETGAIDKTLTTLDVFTEPQPVVWPATREPLDKPIADLLDQFSMARSHARALVATAIHTAGDADPTVATRSIERTLALARAMNAQQVPLAVLVGSGIEDLLFDALKHTLYQPTWNLTLLNRTIAILDRQHRSIERERVARADALLMKIEFPDADDAFRASDPKHVDMLHRGYNTRDAHYHLARTALAVERYRLTEGRLPQALTDLPVPAGDWNYLADPFAEANLRYRPDPTWSPGFALYSVGPDGHDDDGIPASIPGEITDYEDPLDALLAIPVGDVSWAPPERDE